MTLRSHILRTVSRLTPGDRDAFAWIIAALVVVVAVAVIGAVVNLEMMLRLPASG